MSKWGTPEILLMQQLYPTMRTDELANKLNRSMYSISGMARRLGLKKSIQYLSKMKSEVSPSRKRTMRRADEITKEISIEDLCYIAGLFDGEGSITLCQKNDKYRLRKLRLHCQIANTDRAVLEWIQKLVKFGSVYEGAKANKQCYHYFLSDWQTVVFLEAIFPYLRIKRNAVIDKIQKWKNQI